LNTKRETGFGFGFGFSSVENAKFAFPAPVTSSSFKNCMGFCNYTEVDEIYALI
jgi:hypothetical protein